MMSGPRAAQSRAVAPGPVGPAGWPMGGGGACSGIKLAAFGPPRPMQAAWLASRSTQPTDSSLSTSSAQTLSQALLTPAIQQEAADAMRSSALTLSALSFHPACGAVRQRLQQIRTRSGSMGWAEPNCRAVRYQVIMKLYEVCKTGRRVYNVVLMRRICCISPIVGDAARVANPR
uniref:SCY domain-containing protein n=1 Tax=Macrostomum lignano TaxID=282301 RepID=A0A1I8FQ95_9PLAT